MNPTLRAVLAAIAPYVLPVLLVVMFLAGARIVQYEREVGALRVELHQADSLHAEAVSAAAVAVKVAEGFKVEAARLQEAARREVAKDRVVQQRTDSVAKESANERDAARRMLADSQATTGTLRKEIGRLVEASQSDSTTMEAERQQHERTVASLLATVHADSLALAQQTNATQAEMRRALLAEQQVSVLRKQQPSFLGRHLSVTVGYGATVNDGRFTTGPAAVAGWRVFP